MFTKTILAAGLTAMTAIFLTNVSWSASLEDTLASVHRLYHGDRFACSAVAIEPQTLLTAAHCVPTAESQRKGLNIRIEKKDGPDVISFESMSVSVEDVDYKNDTARIKLKDLDKSLFFTTDISDEYDPTIGQKVFAIGYPRGAELTLTEGMFTAHSWIDDLPGMNGPFYKTTVPIMGGSSGGGLYQMVGDEYFLVGLATAGYRDVSFQTYFSTLENVKKVVQ